VLKHPPPIMLGLSIGFLLGLTVCWIGYAGCGIHTGDVARNPVNFSISSLMLKVVTFFFGLD